LDYKDNCEGQVAYKEAEEKAVGLAPTPAVDFQAPASTRRDFIALLLYLARHRKFFPSLMSIFGPAVRLFT
jgi:hypothetical protein